MMQPFQELKVYILLVTSGHLSSMHDTKNTEEALSPRMIHLIHEVHNHLINIRQFFFFDPNVLIWCPSAVSGYRISDH